MGIARALVVVAACCLAPVPAEASPAKAWAAAKARLPANTRVLVGLDVSQLTRSMLFKSAFPMLLRKASDVADTYDRVKTTCGLDPLTAIRGVVVGTDQEKASGAIFLSVRGLTEATLVTCIEALARASGAAAPVVTVTRDVTRDGAITELAVGADKVYLSWIGKDVLVLPMDISDKAQLQRWTGGKRALAKAPVGRYLGKVKMASAAWLISTVPQELEGMKMKAGYGWLAMADRALSPDLHLVLGSAADAQATAAKATQELEVMTSGPGLAEGIKTILRKVTVAAVASEVTVTATVSEAELLSIGATLMRGNLRGN